MTSLLLRSKCALAAAWLRSVVQKAFLTVSLPAATNTLPSSTDGSSYRERRGEGKGKRKIYGKFGN